MTTTTYAPYTYTQYEADEGAIAAGMIIIIVSVGGFVLCCCAPCIIVAIYCCVHKRQQPVVQQEPQSAIVVVNAQSDGYNNDYGGGPQQFQQPQQGGGAGLYGGAYPTPPPPQEPNWAQPSNTNAGYNQPGPVTNGWVSSPHNGGAALPIGGQQQPMGLNTNTNDREAPTNSHPANFNPQDYSANTSK